MSNQKLPLHLLTVADSTRRVYSRAVSLFLSWASTHHPAFDLSSSSATVVDALLAEYINSLFDLNPSRGNLQLAINCRAGILLAHPWMLTRLPFALATSRGWDKKVQRVQRPPMPIDLFMVIVRLFIRRGNLQWALVTWMCFDGYFRVSEMFNRVPEDFILQNDILVVYLDKSKTGQHQSVIISNPHLITLFKLFAAARCQDEQRFFYVSLHGYREALSSVLVSLNAGNLGLTPHSLRHGGATHDFITESRSFEQIVARGRWQQEKSARNYLQAAKAIVLNLSIDADIRARGSLMQQHPERLLKGLI